MNNVGNPQNLSDYSVDHITKKTMKVINTLQAHHVFTVLIFVFLTMSLLMSVFTITGHLHFKNNTIPFSSIQHNKSLIKNDTDKGVDIHSLGELDLRTSNRDIDIITDENIIFDSPKVSLKK